MNLYAYVRSGPTSHLDPFGLWWIYRHNTDAATEACPEEGDTVAELAEKIGLDESQYRQWLTVPKSDERFWGFFGIGARPPAKSLPASAHSPLKGDCFFKIPNTIYMLWAGDRGASGKFMVGWGKEQAYLKGLGFHVVVNDLGNEINSASDLTDRITTLSEAKQLHGLYTWAHGSVPRFGNTTAKNEKGKKEEVGIWFTYASVKAALKYDLGVAVLNACSSGPGARSLVSKRGIPLGHDVYSDPSPDATPQALIDWYTGGAETEKYHKLWEAKLFPRGTQATSGIHHN